jgi:hypothetical protein
LWGTAHVKFNSNGELFFRAYMVLVYSFESWEHSETMSFAILLGELRPTFFCPCTGESLFREAVDGMAINLWPPLASSWVSRPLVVFSKLIAGVLESCETKTYQPVEFLEKHTGKF